MGSIYDARWEAAKKEAERVQRALKKGLLVMKGNERVGNMHITEEGIFEHYGRPGGGGVRLMWFYKDKNVDSGYYRPVAEIRAEFRKLEFFKPVRRV